METQKIIKGWVTKNGVCIARDSHLSKQLEFHTGKPSRDVNAAINILSEGTNIIGSRTAEFTLAENPTVDDRLSSDLKSGGSLKQEGKTNFY